MVVHAEPAPAAGAHSHHHKGEWRDVSHLHPRYRATLRALQALASARTLSEHAGPAEHLDVEVDLDAPFFVLQGRDALRTALYGIKWLHSRIDLEHTMYRVHELDAKRTSLEVLYTLHVWPRRPWWAPATWLLPRTFTLHGVKELRISKGPAEDGSRDVVTRITSRLHNWDQLWTPIRLLNGVAFGYLPAATEQLWAPVLGLVGLDHSARPRAAGEPSEGLLGVARGAATTAGNAASRATTSAGEGVRGAVTSAAEGARGAVASAAETTRAAAASAADTAAGVVAGVAGKGADVAGRVGLGGGAVSGAAESAKHTAASAAAAAKSGADTLAGKAAEVAHEGGGGGRKGRKGGE